LGRYLFFIFGEDLLIYLDEESFSFGQFFLDEKPKQLLKKEPVIEEKTINCDSVISLKNYPNVEINLNFPYDTITIRITNLIGTVKAKETYIQKYNIKKYVNINQLEYGVYFLTISNEKNTICFKRFAYDPR
jgi:hypothetical protein